MRYSKSITADEAKELGVFNRHTFASCDPDYPGSGVYLIEFDNGIKVGMAKSIRIRLESYAKPWVRPIKNIACYRTTQALALESQIKRRFSRSRGHTPGSSEFLIATTFNFVKSEIEKDPFFHRAWNSRYSG